MVKSSTIQMFLLTKIQHKMKKQNITIEGTAFISDEINLFSFAPEDPVPGSVNGYRKRGTAQQMTDGTFDFVACPCRHSQAKLIKKLAHGRASETKDGGIQLTLKVYCDEGVNISETIRREAYEATDAIKEYQLRGLSPALSRREGVRG